MLQRILAALALFCATTLIAEEPPEGVNLDEAPTETLGVEDKKLFDEPLELDELVVTSERFTPMQEAGLRFIRGALGKPKRLTRRHRHDWVCWYRKPVGTHFTYLECARNGDINALLPQPVYPPYLSAHGPEFGKIWRSPYPVRKGKMKAILDSLPGSDELDREFVAMQLAGKEPPRDIPEEEELDRFAAAFGAVNASGGDDDELVSMIEAQGMTLERYNRIVELLETYQSLGKEVANRVGRLQTAGN